MPQVGEDRNTAPLELGSLRVLVLVDHVLVDALEHQHPGLRLHPGGDERGKVQPGAAVEQELVVDELIRDIGRHRIVRQPIAWGPHVVRTRGSPRRRMGSRPHYEWAQRPRRFDAVASRHYGRSTCHRRRRPRADIGRTDRPARSNDVGSRGCLSARLTSSQGNHAAPVALWRPDPSFYASPRDAAAAPHEKLAYLAAFSRPADMSQPGSGVGVRAGRRRHRDPAQHLSVGPLASVGRPAARHAR
jgi:hypothetical protein